MAPSLAFDSDGQSGASSIDALFSQSEVLLTGATGFLGKALLEKLLRSCPQISTLYLVVRPKKGLHPEQRIRDIFDSPLFSKLEGKWESKVVVLSGDVSLPDLGLCQDDALHLLSRATVVIHSAATVRFDEPLAAAAATNVAATKHVLEMAKKMPNLKAMVHVSTAYSNCPIEVVDEVIYQPPMSFKNLLKLTESLDPKLLDRVTPHILGDWPNTYVFTKQIAEDLVATEGKNLPVAIFRPSIVVCTAEDPVPGWTDNMYGTTGIMVGAGTGLLRTTLCDANKTANIVPVDMVANAVIAVAARTAQRSKESSENKISDPLVYNYVVEPSNPICWSELVGRCLENGRQAPPHSAVWYIALSLYTSKTAFLISALFLHFLPALIVDTVASVFGKSPNLLKLQKKIYKVITVVGYFTVREWRFKTDNVRRLWEEMSPEDKKRFPLDMTSLNWEEFCGNYTRGVRRYLLGEDPSSIPRAITRHKLFFWLHHILLAAIFYGAIRILWSLFNPLIYSIIT